MARTPCGTLTFASDFAYNSIVGDGGVCTITFDVDGIASGKYSFSVTGYGNGTLTVRFVGPQPVKVVSPNSASSFYSGGTATEIVTYTASFSKKPLIIFYSGAPPLPAIDGFAANSCAGVACNATVIMANQNDVLLAYGATGHTPAIPNAAAVDVAKANDCFGLTTCSLTGISTRSADDFFILYIGLSCVCAITSISSPHLTWAQKDSVSGVLLIEYASASGILSGESITVTSSSFVAEIDLSVVALSGTMQTFDTGNGNGLCSGCTSTGSSITTTVNDIILVGVMADHLPNTLTPKACCTFVQGSTAADNGEATRELASAFEIAIVPGVYPSIGFTSTVSSNQEWEINTIKAKSVSASSISIADSLGSSWATRELNVSIGSSRYSMSEFSTLIVGPAADTVTFTGGGDATSLIVFAVSGTLNLFDGGTVVAAQIDAAFPAATWKSFAPSDFVIAAAFDSDSISPTSCCVSIVSITSFIYGASEYFPSVVSRGQSASMVFSSPGNSTVMVDGLITSFVSEPHSILFKDDFLYVNQYQTNFWTNDQYLGINNGASSIYTNGGFLDLRQKAGSNISATHFNIPSYDPSLYSSNGTIVKRKLTVSMYPFLVWDSGLTATIRVGISPLVGQGYFPGIQPYGTPYVNNQGGNCNQGNGLATDPFGDTHLSIHNDGTINSVSCADGTHDIHNFNVSINPTLYTVITVETFGVFCSVCADNAYPGTQWAFFRLYQEDIKGNVVASTDQSYNTTIASPLYQKNYVFVEQGTNGSVSVASFIDLVDLQNYGSPVNLGGIFLPNFPSCIGFNCDNGIIGIFALISVLIGGGDIVFGGIILMFLMLVPGFILYVATKSVTFFLIEGTAVVLFLTYAGLLITPIIFVAFVGYALLGALIFMRFSSGGGGAAVESVGGRP